MILNDQVTISLLAALCFMLIAFKHRLEPDQIRTNVISVLTWILTVWTLIMFIKKFWK